MNQIRVKTGIVVEVNDNGDTITVKTEDQLFIDRFYQTIDKLNEVKVNVNEFNKQAKSDREKLQYMIEQTREIMAEMDELFGEGCCKKVFGDIVPDPYLIADFFDQMTPVLKEYTKERRDMIDKKYNRGRKGGKVE